MTSSQGTDISTQTNQSRIAISQPQAASRPRSIAELAEMAKDSFGEGDFPFKTWLRIAENARRDAKSYQEQSDFESAFVEYAKAATVALEKIPAHPDYRAILTSTQRNNMSLHGQEMLDSLADIKCTLVNRYEQWRVNPSSLQVQSQHPQVAPASDSSPQASVFCRSVYSNETNTLSPFSNRSSPWMSIRSRGHRLPPYGQSSHEEDRVQHERVLDIPEVVEEQGTLSGLGLIGALSLESSESSTSTVLAEGPPPPFIPLPFIPSPSPASPTHSHSSSSSSNPLPTPPQERHDPGFSLPPPQMPKPPRGAYYRVVRYGFWNRRGDYLTMDKYVVYAPRGRMNPPDLENYPVPTEGYMDHNGNFIKYDPMLRELPESLPRPTGQPPLLPYDKFVTYVYLGQSPCEGDRVQHQHRDVIPRNGPRHDPYDHHSQSTIPESSESSTVLAESPPPLFIPPRAITPAPSTVLAESPPPLFIPPRAVTPAPSSVLAESGAPSTILAESPPPLFIPPRPITPTSSTHLHRPSSSSILHAAPPQEQRDPRFSLPPPQAPKPPRGTYHRAVRYGFWNRRGDYLTMDKYIVYAPQGRANPPELENYPPPTEGYMDHYGNFIRYDPTRQELPESLPRLGQPPLLPYDKFITYVYL